jgi:hypothetical protein
MEPVVIVPDDAGEMLMKLMERMTDQVARFPDIDRWFTYDRNGLRQAIAAIEDETAELYDEWAANKRHLGNCADEVRHELLDIAAVALLMYERVP